MVRIIWTTDAIENVENIRNYLREYDPRAAEQTASRLIAAANGLEIFPNRGRQIGSGFRELVSDRPYIIRYLVEADAITILRIRHAAQLQDEPRQP